METWQRMDQRVTSRVKTEVGGVNVFNKEDWPTMDEFLIDATVRMHAAFKEIVPRLRRL
jgi:uncharacterized protein DUF4268